MPQWHARTGIGLLMRCFVLDFRVFSLRFETSKAMDPIWQVLSTIVDKTAPWWLSTARRRMEREAMRTNGKQPGPPTRPHETVAVSPSPAFIKALASSGPCWYTYGGDVFIAGSSRMMAIDYASRIATESETACVGVWVRIPRHATRRSCNGYV